MTTTMEPRALDAAAADAVIWRRHLHRHPELSFQEHETARFVRETLESCGAGLEVDSPTPTSVVARQRGARPGKTVALRADIDALPIVEESGVEFGSEADGVMHACGHDGHTAMMLAVARLLAARRDELEGEIRFLFQHAEELPPGGARDLVAAGVLEGVDAVVGCHLFSTLELGRVAVLDGAAMAAADMFGLTIRGRGGHGAFPHETVDPVAVAAQAITNLQHVVARNTRPLDSVVLSVTRISGGTADNIIPEAVELGGTVRMFSEELRARTRESMARILGGVTAAHGAGYELDYTVGYDPVVNDPELAALVREVVAPERLVQLDPIMGGDDFSAYLREVPGVYFFVGAGASGAFPHHHPRFTIDERAFPLGIDTMSRTALSFLT
jgi:amidohydrolase